MDGHTNRRLPCLSGVIWILAMLLSINADAANPIRNTWNVNGVVREALVAVPSNATTVPAPVVFAFHQHGDSMWGASSLFHYHTLWPEAIVVYMQGLRTPGQFIDPRGNLTGWQKFKGDQYDRDLNFFDTLLASIRNDYKIDESRIYGSGHSNGGNFTYLLWAERGPVFAAMAPSAGVATGFTNRLKPMPVLHVAGTNDGIVSYSAQNATIEAVKAINQCGTGTPWEKVCTLFASPTNNPAITMLTKIGHAFPSQAPSLIVKFFQAYAKPAAPVTAAVTWITADGTTSSSQPTIAWNPVAGAARYDVWLNDMTNGVGQFIRDQNITATTLTPPSPLDMGTYHIWVRGLNAFGIPGPWSDRLELKVVQVPQIFSPVASTPGPRLDFSWNEVAGATLYQIWISQGSLSTAPFVREDALLNSEYTPNIDFPAGQYRWWVRARATGFGPEAIGPWTPAQSFTVTE